ncbi:hypothetical protein GO150_003561 [Salmonella enterica subsp. diarizonae]|uniref:Uncharacterized protein n=1 Tax=Salmonella enteritidis TaxID=149539 RepID=A0A403FLP9_SALEN|nr:hypothetical protein [Salmonella enterica subsp. diarizonae]EED4924941.1 hypothetical protein [Salmonella enterica subsp. arizonae]EGX4307677.1 hypothetical protein [Salmonella enterica]MJY20971.1 hypothetical protein [Salmonella enterica subsp. enterica serovar Enteritidis]ECO0585775.1 hypothetical protein [Salmonella enterica subsp. diarizonae]
MRVYLVTTDCYFHCGLVAACHQKNIEVIGVKPGDISELRGDYRIHESDTLVIALDAWRGRIIEFITDLKILSSLKMKTILVSESMSHIRRAGGYQLSKCSPFSDYVRVFLLPRLTYEHAVRNLPLSAKNWMMLEAFYHGLPERELCQVTGGNVKKIYSYKTLMLRSLGIRRFNYLYQMF